MIMVEWVNPNIENRKKRATQFISLLYTTIVTNQDYLIYYTFKPDDPLMYDHVKSSSFNKNKFK